MLRIWSEHLPLEEAASRATLDLLERGALHPILAVHADADLDAVARALRAQRARGLEPGIWPLLTDAQGYWPNETNALDYFARVDSLLDALERQGAQPAWLAVDLEPPLAQVHALRHQLERLGALIQTLRHNLDAQRFAQAVGRFTAHTERVHARGVKTLAVTLPMAAHDLGEGRSPLWQDLFEAPWAAVPWTRAGIMAYGSMVSGYSRGVLSEADARAIHYRLFLHLRRTFGGRAHASLGVTGVGKLGDEPAYARPEALGADAAAARAAGIEDLAIFCLEGLLWREDSGAWVDAVVKAVPREPPMTAVASAVRVGAHVTRAALRALAR